MAKEISNDALLGSVENIKKELENGKSSISTNWAINKHFGLEEKNDFREEYEIERVSSKIIEDPKYTKSALTKLNDYWISINPGYLLHESTVKTNRASRLNIFATLALGLIVASIQIDSCIRDKKREHREEHKGSQEQQIQERRLILDSQSQQRHLLVLEGITLSIQRLNDSLSVRLKK